MARNRKKNTNRTRIVDKKWDKLFEKYDILYKIEQDGYFNITSNQINKFREARLMTKFDHRSNLPNLFFENNLSILPTTRGTYIIGKFNAYKDIELDYDKIEIEKYKFPNWIEGINPYDLYSESSVIHCAYISGMIRDVMEDENILPVISGRMGTPDFDFKIRHSENKNSLKDIKVSKSQCEIDGGYEGIEKVLLLEAKNSISEDFLVRQLYYPYRLWQGKLTKEIMPVFLIYSNDIFSFFIYQFEDPLVYNSLKLIKQKHYVIEDDEVTLDDIKGILQKVEVKSEPEESFPQADVFYRVLDLLFALQENDLEVEDITLMQDFDQRQARYYSSAGVYLGLIESKGRGQGFKLSELGQKIMSKKKKQRNLHIAECILEHQVFNKALRFYFNEYRPAKRKEVYKIMKEHIDELYRINSDNTINRRAQTVVRWIDWIMDLQG